MSSRPFVCVKCGLVVEIPVLPENMNNVAPPPCSNANRLDPDLRCPDETCRGRLKRDLPK